MTMALVWGLRTIIAVAKQRGEGGRTLLQEAVSEKSLPDPNTDGPVVPPGSVGSFSRISGAFGALALAIATIGIAYWVVYALFYEKNLNVLQNIGWFYASGAALFAPYAFNQLSSMFKLN